MLAHRCADQYGGLAFIDTGTAVPGVAEFVHDFAACPVSGRYLTFLYCHKAARRLRKH